MRPELLNALTLAYLGDAIFEVYIREYLVIEKQIVKPNDLQKAAVDYVSAYAQAGFMKAAMENGWLTDEEISIYKRGRNTKGHGAKNKKTIVHNQSSGFEAIIGHLYLEERHDRIKEIVNFYKNWVDFDKNQS